METKGMRTTLPKSRRQLKLFAGFDTLQFASVMGMVVFVLLLVFMTMPTPHHGLSVDVPHVDHSIPMPGARREDALMVSVTRDGKVYFGVNQIRDAADLCGKVIDRLKDHAVERKVYITADMRARWGAVKPVLDGVRDAGILRVAFMANPYPVSTSARTPLSR